MESHRITRVGSRDPKTLGGMVALARLAKGLSQEKLGELAGMNCSFIAKLETNKVVPKEEKLKRISSHLGLDEEVVLRMAAEERKKHRERPLRPLSGLEGQMKAVRLASKLVAALNAIAKDEGILVDEVIPTVQRVQVELGCRTIADLEARLAEFQAALPKPFPANPEDPE